MAADPMKRKTFIDSIAQFLDTWNFDGVDLDWVKAFFKFGPRIIKEVET